MAFFPQFDDLENDFQQEVGEIIDDILGENLTDAQKEELCNSFSFIFNRYTKKHNRNMTTQFDENTNYKLPYDWQNYNRTSPVINLYFLPPSSGTLPPATGDYQPPIVPMMTTPNTYQFPLIQHPTYIQQPQFNYFNQLLIPDSNSTTKKRKNLKSKSTKSKDKKKSSKSNPEKSKKDVKKQKENSKKDDHSIIKTFTYDKSSRFNGIFEYLTEKAHGNPHDNGTIEITSNNIKESSIYGSSFSSRKPVQYHPKNLIKSDDSEYIANGGNDAWITFDFKDMKVEITNYSVKNGGLGAKIKNWVIETSNNKKDWKIIDTHSDYTFNNKEETFNVAPNGFARYIKLRHNGQTSASGMNLVMIRFEIFGKLKMH